MKQTVDFFSDALVFFIFLSLFHVLDINIIFSTIPFLVYVIAVFFLVKNTPPPKKHQIKQTAYAVILVTVSLVSLVEIWFVLLNGDSFTYRNRILLLFPTLALIVVLFYRTFQEKDDRYALPEQVIDDIYARSSLMMAFCTAAILSSLFLLGMKSVETGMDEFAYFSDKFTQRGLIPPLTLFLFFWGMTLYFLRASRLFGEFKNIKSDYDRFLRVADTLHPIHDSDTTDDETEPLKVEAALSISEKSKTIRMVRRSIAMLPVEKRSGFKVRISDGIWLRAKSFYMFPGWINWSIPILGFLGTVLGISMASEGISRIIGSPEGIGKLTSNLSIAIHPLGIAFDTTLIALSLSLLLMLCQTTLQKWEEKNLLNIETYIQSIPSVEDPD